MTFGLHTAHIPRAAWSRAIGEPLADPARLEAGLAQIDDGYWQGLPLGGLGSGSIGRTYRGDFARWHLDIGRHHMQSVSANQFCVRVQTGNHVQATVLSCQAPSDDRLRAWNWSYPTSHGTYYALFPEAWFVYDPEVVGCDLTVKQFSPVLPGNYRESSYPVGVFEATVHNPSGQMLSVSLMLTWENLVGWERGVWHRAGQVNWSCIDQARVGVVLGAIDDGPRERWDGQFAIATEAPVGGAATCRARFRADGDGSDLWTDFVSDGRLENLGDGVAAGPGEEIGAAVAVSLLLEPGETRSIPFTLAWDFPIMQFGPEGRGRQWYRRYTAFFGTDGARALTIAVTALQEYLDWACQIEQWHASIAECPDSPNWYSSALFNELYYLVDGGTAWENGEVGAVSRPIGRFAQLECFDYPFYSTLDVRFYSSWALLLLWPELELQEIRQFAATVAVDDSTPVTIAFNGASAVRKRAGALPHDLGAPDDDPWIAPNSYTWQNINIWKDLNSKFVLMVYRDYVVTRDLSLVVDCWPAVSHALAYLKCFDRDNDGIPENDGVPDQTYDTWPMYGASAYCGGLWLAALHAAEAMANLVGDAAASAQYRAWRRTAEVAYERLWTGAYYRFDSGPNGSSDTIMADQLCGQWYAQATGLPPIVPIERVPLVLKAVFAANVMAFGDGRLGAVNGMLVNGSVDTSSDQSQEVWTGVSYALAAFMLHNDMQVEALQTAWGVYDVTYRARGLWFRTPEAWTAQGEFRASMYMRPASIWAMEHARRVARAG